MVKGADAARVKVPVCMLPSKDEDAAEVCSFVFRRSGASAETHQMAKFDEGIKANPSIADKSVFKTFTNAVHGFAAARADVSVLRSPEGSADGRQLAQGRPGQGGLRRGIHGVDQVLQERVRLDGYEIPSTPSCLNVHVTANAPH